MGKSNSKFVPQAFDPDHPVEHLHLPRQRAFVERLVENVKAGMPAELAKVDAVHRSYSPTKYKSSSAALKKADRMLGKLPHINVAVRALFEAGGFDLAQMRDLHIAHMRGEIERQHVTAQGVVVRYKPGPDLVALLEFEKLVMPRPARELRIGGSVGVDIVEMARGVPAITARSLVKSVVLAEAKEKLQDDD